MMARAALGAVLAGGRSRRMGAPKALVPLAGRPLITYPLEAVRGTSLEPVVIAKPDSELPRVSCRVVREPAEPAHPLHGIITALSESGGAPIVAIGCDMPLVSAALLQWLAELDAAVAVLEVSGRMQPLVARYDSEVAPSLRGALRRGAPLRDALGELGPRVVSETELSRFGEPGLLCMNVNTPEDLERAAAVLPGGSTATRRGG
jgi:molybdenum cofactor guanylyltransferase